MVRKVFDGNIPPIDAYPFKEGSHNLIVPALVSTAVLLLQWKALLSVSSTTELRQAFMSAFLHANREQSKHYLTPSDDFTTRVPGLVLRSVWPPQRKILGLGEIKLFPAHFTPHHLVRIGDKLSVLHYIQHLATRNQVYGFYFDVVCQPSLVGPDAYHALREMCDRAEVALRSGVPMSALRRYPGVKAFAASCIDRRPIPTPYRFLFPPLPLSNQPHSDAFVEMHGDYIALGIQQQEASYLIPYRSVQLGEQHAAMAFAVFAPDGRLVHSTNELLGVLVS